MGQRNDSPLLISHFPTYEAPKNHNESSNSFFWVRFWKDSKLSNPIYHPPSPTSKYHGCGCHGGDSRPGREGCKYTPYCMEYVTYSITNFEIICVSSKCMA